MSATGLGIADSTLLSPLAIPQHRRRTPDARTTCAATAVGVRGCRGSADRRAELPAWDSQESLRGADGGGACGLESEVGAGVGEG